MNAMNMISHSVIRHRRVRACLGLPLVIVLAGVDVLPAEEAQQVVEARSQQRSEQRADPVDPVVPRELAVDHVRAQGAGGVEGAAGVVVT